MLTASEILKQLNCGNIYINPFDEKKLNPNSYNISLSNHIKVYDFKQYTYLDPKKENPTYDLTIPDDGLIIRPGVLYLGSTVEFTETEHFIANIDGRSSIGRLGINIHSTAGFGDIGFRGHWTLEISCIHPVKIYAGMEIGQIYFEMADGDIDRFYTGKYLGQEDPTESRMYKEF